MESKRTEGRKVVFLYTDGACSGNQNDTNIGGWGTILKYGDHEKELYGGEANTTNNRMELTALLEGLKALKRPGLDVEVFSDSSYVTNCFREGWYKGWRANGWRNSKKEPVENRDLWEEILNLAEQHKIRFFRVKGHVNVQSKTFNKEAQYKRFAEWNGSDFSVEEFLFVTEKNNRADALANLGIDSVREKE